MTETLTCDIVLTNGKKFTVEYISYCLNEEDKTPNNVLTDVFIWGHRLDLKEFIYCNEYDETKLAVLNNSRNYWEGYFENESTVATTDEQGLYGITK